MVGMEIPVAAMPPGPAQDQKAVFREKVKVSRARAETVAKITINW